MDTPFNITRDEVLGLAAQKLCDAFADDGDLAEIAEHLIQQKVKDAFTSKLNQRIDDFLNAEMQKLMTQEICPVDIWGEKTGKPTTIRDALAERARIFWNVQVNDEGKEAGYGGLPRHERLFRQIVAAEFASAVKENATAIVGAFKAALKADAVRITTEHIDRLIK